MATLFPTIARTDPPYRVLSLDGGGIFGYFTSIMLKKLCKRHPEFLSGKDIVLFAGTSAGALISLLLARAERPRDVVLSGVLERFFSNQLLYSNSLNPVTGMLSLFGLATWSGRDDMMALLDEHFGEMTMDQLKHRVLITSFNFAGDPDVPVDRRRWKPKMFYNFPDNEPDRCLKVKDVAYAAACPATVRPVVGGYSDGGIFSLAPPVSAIAKLVQNTAEESIVRDDFNLVLESFKKLDDTKAQMVGSFLDLWSSLRLRIWTGEAAALDGILENLAEQIQTLKVQLNGSITTLSSISSCPAALDLKDLENVFNQHVYKLSQMIQSLRNEPWQVNVSIKEWRKELLEILNQVIQAKQEMGSTVFGFIQISSDRMVAEDPDRKDIENILDAIKKGEDEDREGLIRLVRSVVLRHTIISASWQVICIQITQGRIIEDLAGNPHYPREDSDVAEWNQSIMQDFIKLYFKSGTGELANLAPLDRIKLMNNPELAQGAIKKERDIINAALEEVGNQRFKLYDWLVTEPVKQLRSIIMLSMGVGSQLPCYQYRDFDFGPLQFYTLPTNIAQECYFSPSVKLTFDSSSENTDFEARQLLGESNYFRLNPDVVKSPVPPILYSIYLARNPFIKRFILHQIENFAASDRALEDLDAASQWLKRGKWVD